MGYYLDKLSGVRLKKCYDLATRRVQRYLDEEIRFVVNCLNGTESVLELGCGYGRILFGITHATKSAMGIDIAPKNIKLAKTLKPKGLKCKFKRMDALDLKFPDHEFDLTLCLQNGICSFDGDQVTLMKQALRVTRPGGRVLLSSYSEKFWLHRVEWFELQAKHGLVGELDYEKTKDNRIVCKDGFSAGAMDANGFDALCSQLNLSHKIMEADDSIIFCEITKP